MIRNHTLQVRETDTGARLDAFVTRAVPSAVRSRVVEAIRAGKILVNAKTAKKGHMLAAGDEVAVLELLERADWKAAPNPATRIPVLHEDAAFLVIDKPAGMPVHPLHPGETDTVVNGLLAAYPELAGVGPDPLFPAVVHRLDAETSGVMLVARNVQSYDGFRAQFRDRHVHKKYVALVCGEVREPGKLEQYLVHTFNGPHRMRVVEDRERTLGRKTMLAITEYGVCERLPRHTLLEVVIRTGVTHQVRCQLAWGGHPIAGDGLYGSREADAGYSGRLFLHASEISFSHPHSGAACAFVSPLPPDLDQALNGLREG